MAGSRMASRSSRVFPFGEKTITFGSEWHFTPEGVSIVKKRFESGLAKSELTAVLDWNNENGLFFIRCPTRDSRTIFLIFHSILRSMISTEGEDDEASEDDEDEDGREDGDIGTWDTQRKVKSTKIKRRAVWERENGIRMDDNDRRQQAQGLETLRSWKANSTWQFEDLKSDLDETISDETLEALATLLDCHFVKSLNEQKIYIGAHSEEGCRRAISKLNVIQKNVKLKPPYLNHIFYTEGDEDIQVTVKRFPEIKQRFFQSTLLDNLQLSPLFDYRSLEKAFTVRCCVYDHLNARYAPVQVTNPSSVIDGAEENSRRTPWAIASYQFKGELSQDPMRHFQEQDGKDAEVVESVDLSTTIVQPDTSVSRNQMDFIQRWANNLPEAPATTAHRYTYASVSGVTRSNIEILQQLKQQPSSRGSPYHSDGLTPVNVLHGLEIEGSTSTNSDNYRIAKDSQPSWDNYTQYDPISTTRRNAFIQVPSQLSANVAAINVSRKSDSATKKPETDKTLNLDREVRKSSGRPPKPVNPEFDDDLDLISFAHPQDQGYPAIEDSNLLSLDFAVLEPFRQNNASDVLSAIHSKPEIEPLLAGKTVSTTEPQNILGPDPKIVAPEIVHPPRANQTSDKLCEEKLQDVSESSTRKYYYTMNQQKRSKSKAKKQNLLDGQLPVQDPLTSSAISLVKSADPLPEFIKEVKAGYTEVVKGARGFHGQVVVQAELGRILLKGLPPRAISARDGHSIQYQDPEALQSMLRPNAQNLRDGPQLHFTNVLTTQPLDMRFLLGTRDSDGKDIWKQNPAGSDVFYEFICQDRRQQGHYIPLTIEIDAESFAVEVKTRHDFGSIYIHGTQRQWDFRITAFGVHSDEENQSLSRECAKAIQLSLYIPRKLHRPKLLFELPEALSFFQIDGIRVHHVTRYNSEDNKSTLKVTQVRELDVDSREVRGKGITVYRGMASDTPRKGNEKLDLWHEASISCVAADKLFEENETLELGDEASWTTETLASVDAALNIYSPACEMLKQMDNIGFDNDNGMEVRPATAKKSVTFNNQKEFHFW